MKKPTLGDTILLIVLVVCTVGSFLVSNTFPSPGVLVIIELKNVAVYKGNLSEDRKVTIKSAFGDVRVQIKNGKVAVVYADCPDKVCVRTGWRSLSGGKIICLPNKVVVRILGEEANSVVEISR